MDENEKSRLKQKLRQEMRQHRAELDHETKKKLDAALIHKLEELIKKRLPKRVHCYLPMGSEADIYPVVDFMLRSGITVVTPKSLPKRKLEHLVLKSVHELEDGLFGTKHPAEGRPFGGSYDLILVPGLAFDGQGHRLGYGGGYYDSFLKDHSSAYKVGVAYPFQMVDSLPAEAHDVRLDEVVR